MKLWHVSGLGITKNHWNLEPKLNLKRQGYNENSAAMKSAEHRDNSVASPFAKRMRFQERTTEAKHAAGKNATAGVIGLESYQMMYISQWSPPHPLLWAQKGHLDRNRLEFLPQGWKI